MTSSYCKADGPSGPHRRAQENQGLNRRLNIGLGVWEDATFTAIATIPAPGIHKLAGTTDAGARTIPLTMTCPDGHSDSMDGSLAE